MSPVPTPRDVRAFATPDELRDWFDANHDHADELWIAYWRKGTGKASVDWSQAVDEALCVGWIDGIRYRLDDERFAQRFTPRRRDSIWSAVNVRKVGELRAAGRMRPAGEAAFAARREDRTAVYSYEQADQALTDDELAAFRAVPAAWASWEAAPPSFRRLALGWVASAKRPATRDRRFGELVDAAGRGERPGPFQVARRA